METLEREELKNYISDKIVSNHLNIKLDECCDTIEKYRTVYNGKSDFELFFYYILNKVGSIINPIDHNNAEKLGWLRVKITRKKVVYFQFETEEDYYDWLNIRKDIYYALTDVDSVRMLNFMELSTMNFITDITT